MNCEQTTELLSSKLKGLLGADDEVRLAQHLAGCPACREEADAVTALWNDMGELDDGVPHERMRARFHAALAAFEERAMRGSRLDRIIERFWPERPLLQAGLAAGLLVVGVLAGRAMPSSTDREIAGLRDEIRTVSLVLLDHQSASERLRGVEWSRRVASDSHVVDALLETAQRDPNVNVRLAAIEALSQWLDRPQVAAGLTAALAQQDAPLLQVTLAEVLLDAGVAGSVDAVERMVDGDGVDPSVRDYLRGVLQESAGETPARNSL